MISTVKALLFAVAAIFLSGVSIAQNTTPDAAAGKQPQGDWVVPLANTDIATMPGGEASEGLSFKLIDTQVRHIPEGYEYFVHYAYEIVDRSGLESAARITANFEPTFETLNFNFIHVIRDGKILDRLEETEVTTLRQEDGLDTGIVDGRLTALAILQDVKVGDIVEYGISSEVSKPLWIDHYFDDVPLEYRVGVGLIHYRLSWPKAMRLSFKAFNGAPAPKLDTSGEQQVLTWEIENVAALEPEAGTPPWHVDGKMFAMSTMADWNQVKAWGRPIFDIDSQLPEDFAAKVNRIADKWKTPQDRLTEALRLVQNEIRYVGIEIGLGAHIPRAPAEVLRLGYGDCKDKSVLLVEVLKRLGIDAWPALTNATSTVYLAEALPAPTAFDHMIVKAAIGNRIYWLDPTLTHQGGRGEEIVFPDYGYALAIDDKPNGLEGILYPAPGQPNMTVTETYKFSSNLSAPIELFSQIEYRGELADNQRQTIANASKEQFARRYTDYYRSVYNDAQRDGELSIKDDIDNNIVTVTAQHKITQNSFGESIAEEGLEVYAFSIRDELYQRIEKPRRTPLFMPYRFNRKHSVHVITPLRRSDISEQIESSAATAQFSRKISSQGYKTTVEFALTSNARSVDGEQIDEAIRLANEVASNSSLTFYPNAFTTDLRAITSSGAGRSNDIQTKIEKAAADIQNRNFSAAFIVLNQLERDYQTRDITRSDIQHWRGIALEGLGRSGSAAQAINEAIELNPYNVHAYKAAVGLSMKDRNQSKMLSLLLQQLEYVPASMNDYNERLIRSVGQYNSSEEHRQQYEKLLINLALNNYLGNQTGKPEWIYLRATKTLVTEKRIAEAKTLLPYLSSPSSFMPFLVNKKYEPLWPELEELAGNDLSKAMRKDLNSALVAYINDPLNYLLLTSYIDALRASGNSETAVSIGAPLLKDWDRILAAGAEAFWFVNGYTYALRDLGEYEQAHALIGKISGLLAADYPSALNMRINQAIMHLDEGNFQSSLDMVTSMDVSTAKPRGKALIESTKACALYQLGREDESEAALSYLRTEAEVSFYIETLVCMDRLDEAEKLYLAELEDPNSAELLLNFQEYRSYGHVPAFKQEKIRRRQIIQSKPAIIKAFESKARALKFTTYSGY